MIQVNENQQQNLANKCPSASIVLLTFNQEMFVKDALQSLLNQDYENIELVISDDCSTDGTWNQIQKVLENYLGPIKVKASRNQVNTGIVENFTSAFNRTSGDLIFIAAGDDISMPSRCSRSIDFWLKCDKTYDLVAADAVDISYSGDYLQIKESGRLEEWTLEKWFQCRPYFFGASFMCTRKLLNLAPLNNQLPYEDQCLVFRSLLLGGGVRLPEPLIYHRRGGMTQPLGFKFGHRKLQISSDAVREIYEMQQFLNDARIVNMYVEVDSLIRHRMAFCKAIVDLFQGPISVKTVQTFCKNKSISSKLKYRYLRYYFFYPILAVAHSIRDALRIVKRT
jgi:glycosyltransferase involved in cell wall biosynthesis